MAFASRLTRNPAVPARSPIKWAPLSGGAARQDRARARRSDSIGKISALASAALLLAGMISACSREPDSDRMKASAAKTVASNAPLGFARTSPDAQVTLSLPEPIKAYPELHERLYKDGETTLTAFLDQARKDRAEQSADGFPVPAYYQKIEWKISAQSPRLLSVYAEQNDFEGGAHPNTSFRALLWDKDKAALIPTAELFSSDADLKGVDDYVCHQIEAQRARRSGQPVNETAFADPDANKDQATQ